MRIIALLLFSLSLIAAELHAPPRSEWPTWAVSLDKAWNAAYGKGAPKLNAVQEAEYFKQFDAAFLVWVPKAKLDTLPKDEWGATDYNIPIFGLKVDMKHGRATTDNFRRNDRWFIKYANMHNDPVALLFIWIPENRQKYVE